MLLSLSRPFQCSMKRDAWKLVLLRKKKTQSPYSCNIYETYISFPLERERVGAYPSTGVGGQWCGSRHPSLVCGCQLGRLWCLVIWSNTISIIWEDSIPSGGLPREKGCNLLRRTVFCIQIAFRSRVSWCLLGSPVYQPAPQFWAARHRSCMVNPILILRPFVVCSPSFP